MAQRLFSHGTFARCRLTTASPCSLVISENVVRIFPAEDANGKRVNPMVTKLNALLCLFKKDENGATAIEYGLIAALISVAIIAGASALGGNLSNTFYRVTHCVDSANAGTACR